MNYNPKFGQFVAQPPQQNNTMYGYAAPRLKARNTVVLTDEQIAKLKNNASDLQFKISEEDLWRSACTHKYRDGTQALSTCGTDHGENVYCCSICKQEFRMPALTKAEVQKRVDDILDVSNTIKTVYVDMSEDLAANFFKWETLVKKLPTLWEKSVQNFANYEAPTGNGVNTFGPGMSGFSAINSMLSGMPYGYQQPVYYAQPQQVYYSQPQQQVYYGQPQQAPQAYYGQPQQQVYYSQPPVDPNANPMAYGAPQQVQNTVPQQAPQQMPQQEAPIPGIVPGTPAPVPAPTQQTGEIQQSKTFSI